MTSPRRPGLWRRAPRALRSVLVIGTGTAGGMLFTLAVSPVLTRIYSPADLGLFTVVFALVSALASIAALRWDQAIPLPDQDRDVHAIVVLGLGAIVVTAVVSTIVVIFTRDIAARWFSQPALTTWLWAVPAIASLTAVYILLNQVAVRQRRYGVISRRNLFQAIALGVTQIGTGAAGIRPGGLVIGLGVAQVAGVATLLVGSGVRPASLREAVRAGAVRRVLRRYRRIPLVLAPSGFFNVLGVHLPILLISVSHGPEVAGWLGLSQRILGVPVTLLGTAVAQVYLGELVAALRASSSNARALFLRASAMLGLSSIVIAAALIVLGPWLFSVVFGGAWTESGHYARILAISLALQLLAAPLSQTMIVFERVYLQLAWDAGRLLLTSGAVLGCIIGGANADITILAFAVASAAAYVVLWLLSWRTVERALRTVPSD